MNRPGGEEIPAWRSIEGDLVEAYRHAGDPLADAVVQDVYDHNGGMAAVAALLNDILDADELPVTGAHGSAYTRFRETSLELPDFYSDAEIAESVGWFVEHGWTAFCILGCASLPEGYSVAEVTEVLAATKEIGGHTQRRLWETVQFVIDVMDAPGICRDSGEPTMATGAGAHRAQKVRLFHAVIRFMIAQPAPPSNAMVRRERLTTPYGERLLDYPWNGDFGTPINQAQMAGTLLSFSYTILRGLRTLGIELSDQDEAAYFYRWNVIGTFMGVDRDLMVWTFDDAHDLFEHLRRPNPNPEGRDLMDALMAFMESNVPSYLPFLKPTARMLVVHLIGRERAEQAGLQLSKPIRIAVTVMGWVMAAWARVFNNSAPMKWIAGRLYLRMRRHMIGAPRGGDRVFTLPSSAPSEKKWIA